MKKIVIGALVPVMAALGLYLGTGAATAHTTQKATVHHAVSRSATTVSRLRAGTASEAAGTESEASGTESEGSGSESEGAGTESESAADAAAQHADCLKAGIDDSVDANVQYDDQSGSCSVDTGGDNESGN